MCVQVMCTMYVRTWSNFSEFFKSRHIATIKALKVLVLFSQSPGCIDEVADVNGEFFKIVMFGLVPHHPVLHNRTKSAISKLSMQE